MPEICDLVQSLLLGVAKGNPIVQWAWVEHYFSKPEGIDSGKVFDSPRLCARFKASHQYSEELPDSVIPSTFKCELLAEIDVHLPPEEVTLPYQTAILWEDRNGTRTQLPTPDNMCDNQITVRDIANKKEYRVGKKHLKISEKEVPTATSNEGHRQDLSVVDRNWMMYLVPKDLIWGRLTGAEAKCFPLFRTHDPAERPNYGFNAMLYSLPFTIFMPDIQYYRKPLLLSTRPFIGYYQKTFFQGLKDYCDYRGNYSDNPFVGILHNNRSKIEAVEKILLRPPIQGISR